MNVYDFDGTIFYSDCSIGFAFWCMNRHPKLWFTFFPGIIKSAILNKMGKIPNYQLQRKMFSYLTMSVPDVQDRGIRIYISEHQDGYQHTLIIRRLTSMR